MLSRPALTPGPSPASRRGEQDALPPLTLAGDDVGEADSRAAQRGCGGEGRGEDSTLPPGAAGKVGERRLAFEARDGKPRLTAMRCRVPFHVGRALYPERDWPELAHL